MALRKAKIVYNFGLLSAIGLKANIWYFLQKRSYTNMYTLLLRTTKNNRVNLKNKVEDYAEKISAAEGGQDNMDVMLELNFKKSLLADSKEKSKR